MKSIVAGLSMSKLPDFEGLAMFTEVAGEHSIAAAARAMGVSVATVSRAVIRLEDRLGGRLFNSTSRRLALTDYGRRLAERASRMEEMEDFARETSSKLRGLVKLSAPLSFGTRWSHRSRRLFFDSIRMSQSTYMTSTLVPVLEQKGFSKAAKQLGLSPPRVSEMVRSLKACDGPKSCSFDVDIAATITFSPFYFGRAASMPL